MSAETIELKDDSGAVMKLLKYDGAFFHAVMSDIQTRLPAIMNLEGNDSDVIMVSYPKTGTNWVFEMLQMLKMNKAESNWGLMQSILELSQDFTVVQDQQVPRMFATHLSVDRLPESLLKKAKIVLVCRNPKDQAVSIMHHLKRIKIDPYEHDWNSFFGFWIKGQIPFGSYFDFYQNWEAALRKNGYDFQIVCYEDFHSDSVGTLRKLCCFLGYDRTDDLLQQITQKCKIQTMKADKEGSEFGQMLIQRLSTDGSLPFYRKGLIGDWKNYFTVAQSEAVDRLMGERLTGSMFNFRWEMPQ